MRAFYSILLFLASTVFSGNLFASTTYPNDRSDLDSTIQPFYHGVASGDPLNDRVIIWTRVTTDSVSVNVKWHMATDTGMSNIIAEGMQATDGSRDYTVKVDVTGLQPGTYYYYEFEALGRLSQRGRTKTLPTGNVSSLRIGFLGCSNYEFGYFNAYDILRTRNDIDLVIHYGDYIYEYGHKGGGVDTIHRRTFPEDHDSYDLTSYRQRYAWYRLDPSTRSLHQQYPMVVIWDDHEFANDAFADTSENHHYATEGLWAVRKANAIRVFKEWIPMREDTSRTNIINFTQSAGSLADIIYTEDRIQRSVFNTDSQFIHMMFTGEDPITHDTPDRTMHGERQMEWMCQQIKNSSAKWKILANQVVFSTYFYKGIGGFPFHQDQGWDANPLDRKKIIDTINQYNIKNVVVLSGDIHVGMAFDIPNGVVPYNPTTGAGTAGVEFVADNIVEGDVLPNAETYMYQNNAHLRFIKLKSQGYCIIDVTPNSVCCDYWETDSVETPNLHQNFLTTLCTVQNENHLKAYQGPAFTPRTFPSLIPYKPRNSGLSVGVKYNQNAVEMMSMYPNPANSYLQFQYFMKNTDQLTIEVYDVQGRLVQTENLGIRMKGLNEDMLSIKNLAPAEYQVLFKTSNEVTVRKVIKY